MPNAQRATLRDEARRGKFRSGRRVGGRQADSVVLMLLLPLMAMLSLSKWRLQTLCLPALGTGPDPVKLMQCWIGTVSPTSNLLYPSCPPPPIRGDDLGAWLRLPHSPLLSKLTFDLQFPPADFRRLSSCLNLLYKVIVICKHPYCNIYCMLASHPIPSCQHAEASGPPSGHEQRSPK